MTMTSSAAGGSGQQQAAANAQSAVQNFLSIAPKKPYAILGSVASGSAGGATANVTWQQNIPIVPAFCTAIDYEITLPITITCPTTQAFTFSPFMPYSAVAMQLTLGGAPPWPLTELTPWFQDWVRHHIEWDPRYAGYGAQPGSTGSPVTGYANGSPFANIFDQGPSPEKLQCLTASASGGITAGTLVAPGQTVTNAAGSTSTYTFNLQFKCRIILQRKRHLLWGAVPFGDPENRPSNLTQILPFIGSNPEQNLLVNCGAGVTCVLTSAATIKATYELAYVDLLPPGLQTAPQPSVGYGLQLIQFSTTGLNSGTINPITHRTAMLYTAIDQYLINGQLPIEADYFGLWDDQDQQSARYAYDAQNNTFTEYFDKFQRDYRHYPYLGQYLTDMEGGSFPEIPSLTLYDAFMSPDASYAQAFGIPVTPAMTTAIRIPSATSASSPYIRTYSFGLVRVPY